jgi:hypothetical protein
VMGSTVRKAVLSKSDFAGTLFIATPCFWADHEAVHLHSN